MLDFLASEVQALRLALSHKHKAAAAASKVPRGSSLEAEFSSLCRSLSIPPVRADLAAAHPEKVLAQVRELCLRLLLLRC